jgi:hypothetical protein|tara:strand:+ start:2147 stop:3310 length:1164 start_codon:yes stop_codon:yes gene_type:complete
MNREEIIEKLRTKKGYLKKGAQFLADKWEVDIAIIRDCKKLVTSEEWVQERMNNDNGHELSDSQAFSKHLLDNGLTMADVKSVKFWQNFNGEQRYSVVTHNQWHEQPQVKEELLDYIKENSHKVSKHKWKKSKDPICYEISLPDIHYGKITEEDPGAMERHYMQAIVDLHRKADGVEIERFLLPVGNDGLNSEGYSRATTKGTPQHDRMQWRQSFRGYWHLVTKAIDYLAQFAPVDVVVVQGNHDFERMFYAGEVLDAVYNNNENVNIDNSLNSRKYYEYGINMIMFTHGDKEKAQELPLLIATEQPEMWSRSKVREVHCGHKHKEMLNEYMGTKVRFIPSICANDAWHKTQGYVGTLRCGQAFIWNKNRGLEGYLQTNVMNYGLEK